MKISTIIVVLLFLLASPAWAIDFTPTGSVLTVTYAEPTTNTDGSALNDLARTNVHYRICPTSGACASPYTVGPNVAATASTGGGAITTTVTVPVGPGQEANVEVFATATDTTGNVSPESTHVTKRVDRLSPSAPQ